MSEIPGVEASTGALGHGLSFGIGIALTNKLDKKDNKVINKKETKIISYH